MKYGEKPHGTPDVVNRWYFNYDIQMYDLLSETAFREAENSTGFYLPSIPCHPIGYGIAVKLME